MRFGFRNGLIWIPVTIIYEGQEVQIEQCIVDTGSATTAFDIDLVTFNYHKSALIRRLCGLGGGTQEVICQNIDGFLIDQVQVTRVDIEFGDISSQFGINGFIGNDILSRFVCTIDYENQDIALHYH